LARPQIIPFTPVLFPFPQVPSQCLNASLSLGPRGDRRASLAFTRSPSCCSLLNWRAICLRSSAWSDAVVDEHRLFPWPDVSLSIHQAAQDVMGGMGWLGHIDSLSESDLGRAVLCDRSSEKHRFAHRCGGDTAPPVHALGFRFMREQLLYQVADSQLILRGCSL